MSKINISTDEAKQNKLFYVVSNIIIVNPLNSTCLLLKRSKLEKVHPGKWAFPGGKLEHNDVIELLAESGRDPIDGIDNIMAKLAAREAQEECGLRVNIENSTIISNKVFVRPDNVPVFMVVMATEYTGGKVKLEPNAFSDFAWVNVINFPKYDCIDGIYEDASVVLATYTAALKNIS